MCRIRNHGSSNNDAPQHSTYRAWPQVHNQKQANIRAIASLTVLPGAAVVVVFLGRLCKMHARGRV